MFPSVQKRLADGQLDRVDLFRTEEHHLRPTDDFLEDGFDCSQIVSNRWGKREFPTITAQGSAAEIRSWLFLARGLLSCFDQLAHEVLLGFRLVGECGFLFHNLAIR